MPRLFKQGSFKYVLKADRELPKDQRAVFLLRILTPEKNAELEDGIFERHYDLDRNAKQDEIEVRQSMNTGAVAVETLRHGLEDWDNWIVDGEEVVFKHPGSSLCAMDNIAKIHPQDRHELADAITEGNSLSEEDTKKSESAAGLEGTVRKDPVASAPNNQT